MTRYNLLIIAIICFFIQCKPKTEQRTSEVNADSLQTQLNTLTDSLHTSWNEMVTSDNEKINQIHELINGIAQSCTYDKQAYNQLLKEQEQLKSKRYTSPDSMTSEQIDTYDIVTDSVVNSLHAFYEKTNASNCCGLCDSLLADIEKKHGEVVMYRIRYDNHAKEFNALVTQQKNILMTLKPEYHNLKPKQLFSLMQ